MCGRMVRARCRRPSGLYPHRVPVGHHAGGDDRMTLRPDLVMDDFARYRGKSFEVAAGDVLFPITLDSATPIHPSVRAGGSFSLVFIGPRSPILKQGMYQVRCGEEEWTLFIVPVGDRGDAFEYEVIFN